MVAISSVSVWFRLAIFLKMASLVSGRSVSRPVNRSVACEQPCERVCERVCGLRFRVTCSQGQTCQPMCEQACEQGTCVAPNRCRCDFSYVGASCGRRCQCNGHSDCAGPDRLDVCLKCHNNSMVSGPGPWSSVSRAFPRGVTVPSAGPQWRQRAGTAADGMSG